MEFAFAFGPGIRPLLRLLRVTPHTSGVHVDDREVVIRYGLWRIQLARGNVRSATVTGPFAVWKAIGPRLSLADRGLTLGSSAAAGVCIRLWEPVPGLFPGRAVTHPAVTVTVAEPQQLAALLNRQDPHE